MKGELLGVIARNGGGKSTLARILAGLLKPYYGEIRLDGVELGSMPKSQLWRRIGIVFQDPNIHLFHDTVRDEIKFAQRNSGMEDGDAVMEEFGLKEVWARNPRDLSGGQKEKVAIASVVGYGPEVLILDEPTRGLDVMEKREIMTMVRKMVEDRGVTGIVLTHDLEMIGAFADRTVIISEGRVGFQGDPFEAVQKFSGE